MKKLLFASLGLALTLAISADEAAPSFLLSEKAQELNRLYPAHYPASFLPKSPNPMNSFPVLPMHTVPPYREAWNELYRERVLNDNKAIIPNDIYITFVGKSGSCLNI